MHSPPLPPPQVNASSSVWPSFSWSDVTVPKPRPATFVNWGSGEPGSSDLCGGGNYSLQQADNSWGWDDHNCNNTFVYLCRITRKHKAHCCRERPLCAPL